MSQEILDKFGEIISPYRALWNSVEVSVLAARHDSKWIAVATRLQTSELRHSPAYTLLEPIPDVLVFNGLLPIQELGQLMFSMINEGRLQLRGQWISESMYLSTKYAGLKRPLEANVTWTDPWLRDDVSNTFEHFGLRRPVIQMQSNNANERLVDFIDAQQRKKLDSELLFTEPAFNGLQDLQIKYFRGLELGTYSNCNAWVICQIPLELNYIDGEFTVLMPTHVPIESVRLRVFFRPGGIATMVQLREAALDDSGMKTLRGEPTWPEGSSQATAVLIYERNRISHLDVSRWRGGGNVRIATDLFFDPGRKSLRAALLTLSSKRGNEEFEGAVTRLLTLLGCPATRYSSGDDRKPDVAATVFRAGDAPVVLLVECTRERPSAKFSPLRERARELGDLLQNEADILPVVFVQCEPVQSDYKSASEHGIALVGKSELENLVSWLEAPTRVPDIIKYLYSLRSSNEMPEFIRALRT